jgi:hypothetical protein
MIGSSVTQKGSVRRGFTSKESQSPFVKREEEVKSCGCRLRASTVGGFITFGRKV